MHVRPSALFAGFTTLAVVLLFGCTGEGPTAPDSPPTSEAAVVDASVDASSPNRFRMGQGNATRDLGRLSSHGWMCVPIPQLGVHCFGPGAFAASASVPVLVFDTDDPTNPAAPFLGTEVLIRADLYAGQPCPPEGGEYTLIPASDFPVDYMACHHYGHGA